MKDARQQLQPLHQLIIAYANRAERARYALLFALDGRFAEIIRSTTEILIGQMKLTWWRDILTKTAAERPLGEPLVQQLNLLEAQGIDLQPLFALLDGWEVMLDDFPWDDRLFDQYAQARGEGFFSFALNGVSRLQEPQKQLAKAWALWDFARHCSDSAMRQSAFDRCGRLVRDAKSIKFDRSGRPLSILCQLAARDVRLNELTADLYAPSIAGKIIWHGATGR